MKKFRLPRADLLATAVPVAVVAAALLSAPARSEPGLDVGETVANFSLEDAAGEQVVLYDGARESRGTVLAWTSVECPIAKLYAPRLARLQKEYRGEGIRFFGVDPNLQDSAAEVRQRMADAGVEFPVLMDSMQSVTDLFGITRTTEVVLLDAQWRVCYRGAIDDQYDVGAQKPLARNEYLIAAIEALLAEEEIEVSRTEAAGCLVGRVTDPTQIDLTYHRDVAAILYRNCAECHRPDQVGPMSFLDFEEVRGWAPMIAEVVDTGRMPPWHADPRYGEFENRRILTETERAVLIRWALNGAPEGDPADAPEPPCFPAEGWAIGTPDRIIELPQEQSIPAEGVVPYRYVEVDPQLTEDHWVQAIEIRPTNTAATHHVLVLLIPPGKTMNEVLGGDDDASFLDLGYYAVNVPGCRPNVWPAGTGKFLPAGSRFVFQLHYTPTGTPGVDRTTMGFRWATEEVRCEVKTRGIGNTALDIPPGEGAATFHTHRRMKQPIRLLSIFPHMHTRGAAFRVERVGLDADEVLLDIPRYDFNWQNFYRFREPPILDRGESLYMTAVYDNSAENPFNPDPTARVRWGDQTFEEMFIGYIDYIEIDAEDGTPGEG